MSKPVLTARLPASAGANQGVFVGADAILTVNLYSDGALFDTAANVQRIVALVGATEIDSAVYSAAFDWTTDTGSVYLDLNDYSIPAGVQPLTLTVYDTSSDGDPTNGRVWVEAMPVTFDEFSFETPTLQPGWSFVMQDAIGDQYKVSVGAGGVLTTAALANTVSQPISELYMQDLAGTTFKFYLGTGGIPQVDST